MDDREKLNKMKQILDYLYDIEMVDYIFDGDTPFFLFTQIDEKYLVNIDPESFSDDSEEVEAMKSKVIEWFGDDYGLAVKDDEYFLLSVDMIIDDMKYWFISKMKVNDLEMAKKVAFLLDILDNIESIRIKKEDDNQEKKENDEKEKDDENEIEVREYYIWTSPK